MTRPHTSVTDSDPVACRLDRHNRIYVTYCHLMVPNLPKFVIVDAEVHWHIGCSIGTAIFPVDTMMLR